MGKTRGGPANGAGGRWGGPGRGWRERLDRVRGVVEKEFRQVFRDPRLAAVVLVSPLIQLVVFGYAVSTDIRETPTFVVDQDGTSASRAAVEALSSTEYFRVTGRSRRPADLVAALDRGEAVVGLQIPPGFAGELGTGRPARIQLLLDGTRSNTASVAMSYAERILLDHGARATGRGPPRAVELRERAWYNPDLASRDYNVPAVMGILLLLVCLLLTSLAVVRERETGTLEQLEVSPLTAGELVAGKTLPFGVIGLFDMVLVLAVALWWFDVPFEGRFLLLVGATVLYLLSGLGLGLLVSTVSRTQQEAFMGSFLFFMPAVLLSGFMFPVSSMPAVFRWLTHLNPARHYIRVVRDVFLKGTGPTELWPSLAALAVLGAGLLWFAADRFRRAAEGD